MVPQLPAMCLHDLRSVEQLGSSRDRPSLLGIDDWCSGLGILTPRSCLHIAQSAPGRLLAGEFLQVVSTPVMAPVGAVRFRDRRPTATLVPAAAVL